MWGCGALSLRGRDTARGESWLPLQSPFVSCVHRSRRLRASFVTSSILRARQAGRPGWRSSSLDGALPKGSQATTLVAAGRHPSTMPTSALRHPHDRCVVSTPTWRRFSWRHKTNRNLGLGPGGHPYSARHEQGAWEQIRFGPVPVPSLDSQPGFQPCPPTPLATEESNIHPCCRASSRQSHRAAANCCLFPPPCWAHPVSLSSLPGHPGSMLLS